TCAADRTLLPPVFLLSGQTRLKAISQLGLKHSRGQPLGLLDQPSDGRDSRTMERNYAWKNSGKDVLDCSRRKFSQSASNVASDSLWRWRTGGWLSNDIDIFAQLNFTVSFKIEDFKADHAGYHQFMAVCNFRVSPVSDARAGYGLCGRPKCCQ